MDATLLNEIDKLNGTLNRFDKMNNGGNTQNQNTNTTTTLQQNDNVIPKEKTSDMFDGIMFDIFLSIFIVIVRNVLAIKFDEPAIKKIGYALALVRPYFI